MPSPLSFTVTRTHPSLVTPIPITSCFWSCPHCFHRILGVANEVDQNLQDLVFVHNDYRDVSVIANNLNPVPIQRRGIYLQRVFGQARDRDRLDHPGNSGVALLHGDDLLDVVQVLREQIEFLEHFGPLFVEMGPEIRQIIEEQFSARIAGKKSSK